MHPIEEYPALIAQAARTLNQVEAFLSQHRAEIAQVEAMADCKVAFDPDLKNEQQRKARRAEILGSSVYSKLCDLAEATQQQRAEILVTLEQLRGEFSVARLQAKADLAAQLTASPLALSIESEC